MFLEIEFNIKKQSPESTAFSYRDGLYRTIRVKHLIEEEHNSTSSEKPNVTMGSINDVALILSLQRQSEKRISKIDNISVICVDFIFVIAEEFLIKYSNGWICSVYLSLIILLIDKTFTFVAKASKASDLDFSKNSEDKWGILKLSARESDDKFLNEELRMFW